MFIDGYVIDGPVPVNIVGKPFTEKPPIAGVTLSATPIGSQACDPRKETFVIYAVAKDGKKPTVYATERDLRPCV